MAARRVEAAEEDVSDVGEYRIARFDHDLPLSVRRVDTDPRYQQEVIRGLTAPSF